MNKPLDALANKIAAPRYKGQLPDIRRTFNLYLANLNKKPDRRLEWALLTCLAVCFGVGLALII